MDIRIYKTINDLNYIYKTPSINGIILGVLKKGINLEINSIDNGWALYKYNDTICYIMEYNLQIIPEISTGNVTIKYIDEKTNEDLLPPVIMNDLKVGEYSFTYKNICGYTLNDNFSKTISLSNNSNNVTVEFKYKKDILSEKLIISYIDIDTNDSVSKTIIYDSNSLSDIADTITSIPNYSLVSTEKTSTLSTNLVYKYKKNTGSIKIMYMDESNSIELSDSQVYTDLKLGTYNYTAKDLSGFLVIGNSTKSVQLTSNNNEITIIFNYKQNYLDIDESLINQVPYISTYYINPIVSLNQDVIIDFYITDYYHKEYIDEDFSDLFTVTINIDGKPTIIKTNFTAGDHSVNIGSFSEEKEQNFSIFCTDKYGRSSHELFNYFLVRNEPEILEYKMTSQDLIDYNIKNIDEYEEIRLVTVDVSNQTMSNALTSIANSAEIPSGKYVCFTGDSNNDGIRNSSWKETIVKYSSDYNKDKVLEESTSTRKGLQQLLDDKKAAGYNKIILLNGVYRIDHLAPIYVPTGLTLDLNNSIIKLNSFIGNSALILSLNNTFDSHVINGIIEGDYFSHDYTNSTNNSEWVNGISISAYSKYSSFENLTIKNITGYGATNGSSNSRDGSLSYTFTNPISIGNTFTLGDIDITTGNDIPSNYRTTCSFKDISNFLPYGYLFVGIYLGYQGNPCKTWNTIYHFYDKDKKYIKSISGYLYRKVKIPANSHYLRVTILSTDFPTNLSIQLFRIPINCSFKNIIFNNCRAIGMAPQAMQNMLVEKCEFTNCGQALANCAFDAEDGWDQMQDATFRELNFHDNPNNEFLTAAGHNFIIENMVNGKIYFGERTNSYVVKNSSNITSASLGYTSRLRSGYTRFFNSTISGGIGVNINSKSDLKFIIKDSTIYGRTESGSIANAIFIRCNLGPSKLSTNSYENSLGTATYNFCYIHDKYGSHHYTGIYTNCIFENISGNIPQSITINDSQLNKFKCNLTYEGVSYSFNNCTFSDSNIQFPFWFKGCILTIKNCTINNFDYFLKIPHYSLAYPITLSNNIFTSSGLNGFIYFYDDRGTTSAQNILELTSNNITIPNSLYVIVGLSENTVNNINIKALNNTLSPTTLLLCNPKAYSCANITITKK